MFYFCSQIFYLFIYFFKWLILFLFFIYYLFYLLLCLFIFAVLFTQFHTLKTFLSSVNCGKKNPLGEFFMYRKKSFWPNNFLFIYLVYLREYNTKLFVFTRF